MKRLTELDMQLAFFAVERRRKERCLRALLDDLRRLETHPHLVPCRLANNAPEWDVCVAIVNGRPVECIKIGRYLLLDDAAPRVRLTLAQRYGLWLADVWTRIRGLLT